MKNKNGSILLEIAGGIVIAGVVVWGIWALAHLSWKNGEDVVSGIAYNVRFDSWPAGNTTFQVRAAAEMAVTENTSPIYCLPKGSQYESIVREAAEDKSIKVVVKVKPMPPHFREGVFKCEDNVEVIKKRRRPIKEIAQRYDQFIDTFYIEGDSAHELGHEGYIETDLDAEEQRADEY